MALFYFHVTKYVIIIILPQSNGEHLSHQSFYDIKLEQKCWGNEALQKKIVLAQSGVP